MYVGVSLSLYIKHFERDVLHPIQVHRLDRPVSGLMLYPKSQTANKHVRRLMLEHSYMLKEYVFLSLSFSFSHTRPLIFLTL